MNRLPRAHHLATRVGAALLLLLVAGCATVAPPRPALQRDTPWGPVIGNDDASTTGTWSWKGIPYARPPVGEGR
ncbi:MAG TPA: hypothetical protein VIP27_03575, partial [Variovorax sp.]